MHGLAHRVTRFFALVAATWMVAAAAGCGDECDAAGIDFDEPTEAEAPIVAADSLYSITISDRATYAVRGGVPVMLLRGSSTRDLAAVSMLLAGKPVGSTVLSTPRSFELVVPRGPNTDAIFSGEPLIAVLKPSVAADAVRSVKINIQLRPVRPVGSTSIVPQSPLLPVYVGGPEPLRFRDRVVLGTGVSLTRARINGFDTQTLRLSTGIHWQGSAADVAVAVANAGTPVRLDGRNSTGTVRSKSFGLDTRVASLVITTLPPATAWPASTCSATVAACLSVDGDWGACGTYRQAMACLAPASPPPPTDGSGGPTTTEPPLAGTQRTTALGTNLEVVEDYAVAYPFADFFKQSRPWFTAHPERFDTGQNDQLALDANGWVTSLPACTADSSRFCWARTVFNAAENPWPTGHYTVTWEGDGSLSYGGGARKIAEASSTGRDVVEITGNALWFLTLEATSSANPLRNLRVLAPGIDPAAAPLFHPDFVRQLASYRTIRFMDWMRTNGSGFGGEPNTQQEFSQRPLLSQAQWTRENGVPLEAMVELANVSGTEPWFTLPHRASDAYVDQFAAMVLARLTAGRRVYVEYSNEVWNGAFPQGYEIEQRGSQLYGTRGDAFIRRLNAHGQRSAEVCRAFKARFGTQAGRVTCVLGAQAANAFTATEAADCPLALAVGARTTPCSAELDAVAIAPYFGNYLDLPANADEVQGWTPTQLFAELMTGSQLRQTYPDVATPCTEKWPPQETGTCATSALAEVVPWIRAHGEEARARRLRLLAYEGGQHLVGVFGVENNDAITNLFVAANRDPRMAGVYSAYLQSWRDAGGELFVHFTLSFSSGKFGSWGALEALTPTTLPPKAQALLSWSAANPCWWTGCIE
ncbi:MAG: hypothetical protein FJ137_10940 [Deltaproteobacteria bacterium]|nr:hypothetical protein [Deltaproteobacteria bacterium]